MCMPSQLAGFSLTERQESMGKKARIDGGDRLCGRGKSWQNIWPTSFHFLCKLAFLSSFFFFWFHSNENENDERMSTMMTLSGKNKPKVGTVSKSLAHIERAAGYGANNPRSRLQILKQGTRTLPTELQRVKETDGWGKKEMAEWTPRTQTFPSKFEWA